MDCSVNNKQKPFRMYVITDELILEALHIGFIQLTWSQLTTGSSNLLNGLFKSFVTAQKNKY